MRRTRLTITFSALLLSAVACGTATSSQPSGHGGSGESTGTGSGSGSGTGTGTTTERGYANLLLAALSLPADAETAAQAPSKALEHLPEHPSLSKPPTVVERFWTVRRPAGSVLAWLRQHGTDTSLRMNGSGGSGGSTPTTDYLAFTAASLPDSIAVGDVYVAVAPTGSSTSAIAAYAVTLAQPTRPAAEVVPLHPSSATIAWSLAAGGTPVRKVLTGDDATALARDFDALRVDTAGPVMCPMTHDGNDIVVTFAADGHSWRVTVPSCPDISVARDGTSLPALAFGKPFLADLKSYTGYLPPGGPIQHPGGVIPLTTPRAAH